jgi:cytoskeletal protein CcmA (bactofilin family)
MFEKRNSKPEPAVTPKPQVDNFNATANTPASSGRAAVIGPGIHINGDISGEENLLIEGRVDGKILLEGHEVSIGQNGEVKADITAKVIKISGKVRGDLKGGEKVIIARSGNVHGNIVAPRMTLEDGAIFKGSIDMDPSESAKPAAAKLEKKPVEKKPEQPTVVAADKLKDNKGYSLTGG